MICILLTENPESELCSYFFKMLNKKFEVTLISKNKISQSGKGEGLILLETDTIQHVNAQCIIVIDKDFNIKNLSMPKTISIVSSESEKQLSYLAKHKIPAITCGSSPKDTISFTSNNTDVMVVSLQRAIENINNKNILPFETPTERLCNDEYVQLAYFAFCVEIGLYDNNFL